VTFGTSYEWFQPAGSDTGCVPDDYRNARLGPVKSPVDGPDIPLVDVVAEKESPVIEYFRKLLEKPLRLPVAAIVNENETGFGRMLHEVDEAVAGFYRTVPHRYYDIDGMRVHCTLWFPVTAMMGGMKRMMSC
jgi:hypothetical protein